MDLQGYFLMQYWWSMSVFEGLKTTAFFATDLQVFNTCFENSIYRIVATASEGLTAKLV